MDKYRAQYKSMAEGFQSEFSFCEGFWAARMLIQDLVREKLGTEYSLKLYNIWEEAERAANRTEIKMDDLIGGVACFNAEPFAIDDEELAKGVMECIDRHGFEPVRGEDNMLAARAQLDLEEDDCRVIYRCGSECMFVLP